MIKFLKFLLPALIEITFSMPLIIFFSLISRFKRKKYDIGIGPEAIINNFYHKQALERKGYLVITFVRSVNYITNKFDRVFSSRNYLSNLIIFQVLFYDYIYIILNCRCLYLYFNGGPLMFSRFLWRLEPIMLKFASVKTVLLPYGSDIQVFDRTPNLLFKDANSSDYPLHRFKYGKQVRKVRLWTEHADHVISGCDWVDYMYHWDTLMVAHFSIDMDLFKDQTDRVPAEEKTFRIIHAPNHKKIKGTKFLVKAVEELKDEGLDLELILIEKKPNNEVLSLLKSADLVVDQLIIGWYAMFAIESMLAGKPVVCFLRDDFINLYRTVGLLEEEEPPLINLNPLNLKDGIRDLMQNRSKLNEFASRGYDYVKRLHSTDSVGKTFDQINKSIGIQPNAK
jgi:glycosyltransferase involved in cell wall biosynthesis